MTRSVERIDKGTALAIHSATIARFGGLDGVRDEGLCSSATLAIAAQTQRKHFPFQHALASICD